MNQVALIQARQEAVIKVEVPDSVVYLLEAYGVSGEGLGDVDLCPFGDARKQPWMASAEPARPNRELGVDLLTVSDSPRRVCVEPRDVVVARALILGEGIHPDDVGRIGAVG